MGRYLNSPLIKEITIFKSAIYFNLYILNFCSEHELSLLKAKKIAIVLTLPRYIVRTQ